jgi:hypothetical protein
MSRLVRKYSFAVVVLILLARGGSYAYAQKPPAPPSPTPSPSPSTPAPTPALPAPKSPLTGSDMSLEEGADYGKLIKLFHEIKQATVNLETLKACGGTREEIAKAEKAVASAQSAFDSALQAYIYSYNQPTGANPDGGAAALKKLNEQTLGTPGQRTRDEQKQYNDVANKVQARLAKDNKTYSVPACPVNPGTSSLPAPAPSPSTMPTPAPSPGEPQKNSTSQSSVPASIPVSIAGTSKPSSDYGSGGHAVVQSDQAETELQGTVYDPLGNLRQRETDTYSTVNGKEYLTERQYFKFDSKLNLTLHADYKFDLSHNLTSTDFTHYGIHSERIGEEITNYKPNGYEIKDWSLGTHSWTSDFTTYKFPAQGTAIVPPATPVESVVDVIFPRTFKPGETVTGSLWPTSYGDIFKGVPGFAVTPLTLPLHHLPDGSPEWSGLEIGVKDHGFFPVNGNGRFAVDIPINWKGSLALQAREPDALTGGLPATATIDIGTPIDAPTPPTNLVPQNYSKFMESATADRLIDLWNECYDRENELEEAYDDPSVSNGEIGAMEDDLDDCYDETDYVMSQLPQSVVVKLARGLAQEARDDAFDLSMEPNPTRDDMDDYDDLMDWADFLNDEADYASFWDDWTTAPSYDHFFFWDNPALVQGKLGALRGFYDNDPLDTQIHIDNLRVTPMAATPYVSYFMPPDGLTAGLHNYIVDSPGITETIMPVFFMTLTMSADDLHLHKGQSTTYHVTLNGLNGLPGGAWGGSFIPSDLVSPSGQGGNGQAAASSRTGNVTLDITNQSPDTISMVNVHSILDASFFFPNGSYHVDGGIGAIKDGNFGILGVAQANLNPLAGLGAPPGTITGVTTPSTQAPLGSNWIPSLNWSYNSDWMSKSPLLNTCSGLGAATSSPTITGGASTFKCMDSTELGPYLRAIGDQTSIPVSDNKPDLTQLPEASKRLDDARKKHDAAYQHYWGLETEATRLWVDAISKVSKEIFNDWVKAKDAVTKAKNLESEWREKYKANKTDDNEYMLGAAIEDVNVAERAEKAARQTLIDSFRQEDRINFETAQAAADKAEEELNAAEKEERAAAEALSQLKAATTESVQH